MSICIPGQSLPRLHPLLFQCRPLLSHERKKTETSLQEQHSVSLSSLGTTELVAQLPERRCKKVQLKSQGLSTVSRNSPSPAISIYSQCCGKDKDSFSIFEIINFICYSTAPPQTRSLFPWCGRHRTGSSSGSSAHVNCNRRFRCNPDPGDTHMFLQCEEDKAFLFNANY